MMGVDRNRADQPADPAQRERQQRFVVDGEQRFRHPIGDRAHP